jgi:hypothetical protein
MLNGKPVFDYNGLGLPVSTAVTQEASKARSKEKQCGRLRK